MYSDFTPKFPRTVAGTEWRSPLAHPEIEAIANRVDHLYRNFSLSEDHRAELLLRYAYLAEADKAIDTLGKIASSITLEDDPGIRPARPINGNASGGEIRDAAVGFALRFAAWVQRLEDMYGITAWKRFGEIVNHDEDDNPDPSPGDDI